jgi:hypothetical protein
MDPHTGFALGFLWTRTPSWAVRPHLRSANALPRIRRVNFPTWSWASVTGEIFNEVYGGKSVFEAYLGADDYVSKQSDAYIKFWMYAEGKPIPLQEVMQQQRSNILSEDSSSLLVEGDLVRLTLTNGKQTIPGLGMRTLVSCILGCIRFRPGRSSRFTSRWGPALC